MQGRLSNFLGLSGVVMAASLTLVHSNSPMPATSVPAIPGKRDCLQDSNTAREVRRAILQIDGLSEDGKTIGISCSQGRVILRGFVDSTEELNRIRQVVQQKVGAKNIDNFLRVK